MSHPRRRFAGVKLRRAFLHKSLAIRHFLKLIRDRLLLCSSPSRYRRLAPIRSPSPTTGLSSSSSPAPDAMEAENEAVVIKITLLGDSRIGKTSLGTRFVGEEQWRRSLQLTWMTLMEKTVSVKGARIEFSIWDVSGERRPSEEILPLACRGALAIFFMFDLNSRRSLHSVVRWYNEARRWNKKAISVLVGTKFDDFCSLPLDLQSTIVNQARAYGKAMGAALFFSSTTHNINVNKIFKFVMATIFNLSWNLRRNLTVGEPIIDF